MTTLTANVTASTRYWHISAPLAAGVLYLRAQSEVVEVRKAYSVANELAVPDPLRIYVRRGVGGTARASHSSGVTLTATTAFTEGGGGATPTLAEVLAAGADAGGIAITTVTTIQGTSLDPGQIASGSLTLSPGAVALEGNDNTAGQAGAGASLYGGAGDGGIGNGATIVAFGSPGDNAGGAITLLTGDAVGSSGKAGGDIHLITGAGDGAGRHGLVFLNLPTSDPGVSGALYSDGAPSAGVPKALMVSGG